MRFLASLLLCLAACTVPIYAPTATPEDRDMIKQSVRDLGMRTQWRRSPVGAVHITPVDDTGQPWDGKAWQFVCSPTIEAERARAIMRHEIGHALTLAHGHTPDNVMWPYVGDDTVKLTRWQREQMRAATVYLRGCQRATGEGG